MNSGDCKGECAATVSNYVGHLLLARPPRMHSVHVDAIIRPIPTHVFDTRDVDVSVFLSVCVAVLVTTISPAKTAELIEIEFGGGDLRWPKEPCIRWSTHGRIRLTFLFSVAMRLSPPLLYITCYFCHYYHHATPLFGVVFVAGCA